ncbi:Transposase, mutator type [Acidiphilium sp. PM]|nr:Transposase, mutator type [Acidiphilium sp. PM]
MARRRAPAIPDELLDQLLAGGDAAAALNSGDLVNALKKALAERALSAEMDYHLSDEAEAENSRNGYGRKSPSPEITPANPSPDTLAHTAPDIPRITALVARDRRANSPVRNPREKCGSSLYLLLRR